MASFLQRQGSVEDKYAFIKHLGNGSYGDVWIVVPLDKIGKGTRVSIAMASFSSCSCLILVCHEANKYSVNNSQYIKSS